MTLTTGRSGGARSKLIHSNFCFVAVPLGLCAFAAVVHWLVAFT